MSDVVNAIVGGALGGVVAGILGTTVVLGGRRLHDVVQAAARLTTAHHCYVCSTPNRKKFRMNCTIP
jgi:hypothetical protein